MQVKTEVVKEIKILLSQLINFLLSFMITTGRGQSNDHACGAQENCLNSPHAMGVTIGQEVEEEILLIDPD
jgi:hypothetical protein